MLITPNTSWNWAYNEWMVIVSIFRMNDDLMWEGCDRCCAGIADEQHIAIDGVDVALAPTPTSAKTAVNNTTSTITSY